jgi:hypothetical protein
VQYVISSRTVQISIKIPESFLKKEVVSVKYFCRSTEHSAYKRKFQYSVGPDHKSVKIYNTKLFPKMPTHFDIVHPSLSYLSSHIHRCYEKFVYSIRTTPGRIGYKSVLLNCSPRTTDGPRRSAGCFGRKSIAQIISDT